MATARHATHMHMHMHMCKCVSLSSQQVPLCPLGLVFGGKNRAHLTQNPWHHTAITGHLSPHTHASHTRPCDRRGQAPVSIEFTRNPSRTQMRVFFSFLLLLFGHAAGFGILPDMTPSPPSPSPPPPSPSPPSPTTPPHSPPPHSPPPPSPPSPLPPPPPSSSSQPSSPRPSPPSLRVPSSNQETSGGGGAPAPAVIAGAVVGAAVGALALAALAAFQLRRRSARLLRAQLSRTAPNDTPSALATPSTRHAFELDERQGTSTKG